MNKPVLIAGAGPTGMTLAMVLRRLGVDVRIVDKAAARTDQSKALVIWPRTLELLDIQACVQPFLHAGQPVVAARILAEGKLLLQVRLDTARSIYRAALMIPQSDTERLLEEQLTCLGTQVERPVELAAFSAGENGVAATLRHGDGHEESLTASHLVGCDGAHSAVRHGLGVGFEGVTLPSDWLLADLSLDGTLRCDEIVVCWAPEGVLVLFPISAARFRVIADVVTEGKQAPPPSLEAVQRLLDQRGPCGLRARDPIWMSNFHINERKVKSYGSGRVFLCGDAAHVHSPAGGQGMNTGMQDAFNLAWKLAMVWHEHARPRLLDSYSPERSAIGDQVLRNAGNLTRIAMLRNPILQAIRSLAVETLGRIPALRQRVVDQLTEIDLGYRGTGLTVTPQPHGASHHPAGGDRAPDVALTGDVALTVALAGDAPSAATATSRLHGLLGRGRFAVLSVVASPVSLPASLEPIAVAAQAQASPDYDSGHVYLIRPDAYVMLSSKDGDTAPILNALEHIAGG
jgi:2-polyprenyl-6-methoxyphenol hydroxylase-like FAD-dependent oxidoreductase